MEDIQIKIFPKEEYQKLSKEYQEQVKKAENCDVNSILSVSNNLLEGLNSFPCNIEIGIEYLKLGIKLNNIECIERYCQLLIEGPTEIRNEDKGIEILQAALKSHNSTLCKHILIKYLINKKNRSNLNKEEYHILKKYLKEAADNGDTKSMILYGKLCEEHKTYSDYSTEQNYYEAFKYFKRAAKLGDGEGLSLYGFYLQYPHGLFTPDIREAIKCYKQSIESGCSSALARLAVCYLEGRGVEKDVKEGIRLVFRGIECGDQYSKYSLAFSILKGTDDVIKDIQRGVYLMKVLSNEKNLPAVTDYAIHCLENDEKIDLPKIRQILIESGRDFFYRDESLFEDPDLRYLAAVQWDYENYDKSFEILQKGIDDNCVFCLSYSAEILCDIGKFEESKKTFRKAANHGDKSTIKEYIEYLTERRFSSSDPLEIKSYQDIINSIKF